MDSKILSLVEAAEYLRISEATLRWLRHKGEGPTGFKVGKRVCFRLSDLDNWIQEQIDKESR